jgi:hypothetical protein
MTDPSYLTRLLVLLSEEATTKIQSIPRRRQLINGISEFEQAPMQDRYQLQELLLVEIIRILDLEITHWARD